MKKKLRIGYFADGPWGHRTFQKIIDDDTMEIIFVCVRYDHKDPVLMEEAKKKNIDVLYHSNINSEEFLELVGKYEADIFVSMSFNQIFRKKIINMPPLKTINCHAGKLPFYRGRNILNWVLINDEKEFGITVHYMDEGIDTGDIILQEIYPITDEDTYETLLNKAYIYCAETLYTAIKNIQQECCERICQNDIDPVGMYCGIRTVGDEIICWNQTSRQIFNFVRAICKPGPQGRSYINGKEIKINRVAMVPGARAYINTIGQVVGKTEKTFFVKTADTIVEVTEYEFDGKIRIGDRLKES